MSEHKEKRTYRLSRETTERIGRLADELESTHTHAIEVAVREAVERREKKVRK